MKHSLIFSSVLSAFVALGFAGCSSTQSDTQAFQGTWAMVSGEKDGEPLPAEEVKDAKLIIAGDTFNVHVGDLALKGTQKLDPMKKPKQIDANNAEGTITGQEAGIYEFLPSGDFRVCFAPVGKERPTDFVTKPDSGYFMHVWRRVVK